MTSARALPSWPPSFLVMIQRSPFTTVVIFVFETLLSIFCVAAATDRSLRNIMLDRIRPSRILSVSYESPITIVRASPNMNTSSSTVLVMCHRLRQQHPSSNRRTNPSLQFFARYPRAQYRINCYYYFRQIVFIIILSHTQSYTYIDTRTIPSLYYICYLNSRLRCPRKWVVRPTIVRKTRSTILYYVYTICTFLQSMQFATQKFIHISRFASAIKAWGENTFFPVNAYSIGIRMSFEEFYTFRRLSSICPNSVGGFDRPLHLALFGHSLWSWA